LRLHSFRALRHRRPRRVVTVLSAVIGSGSHVVIDGFTHTGRFGSRWLGWDRALGTVPGVGVMSIARVFQYVGHTFGSALGVGLLAVIGRRRLIDDWYGRDTVRVARSFALAVRARMIFWLVVAAGPLIGAAWARAEGGTYAFAMIDATAAAAYIACLLPTCRPSSSADRPELVRVRGRDR
jgi:Domain of unknown function (DUF4184)